MFIAPDHLYLGIVESDASNYDAARRHLERALDVFVPRESDRLWTPVTLYYLGTTLYFVGEIEESQPGCSADLLRVFVILTMSEPRPRH